MKFFEANPSKSYRQKALISSELNKKLFGLSVAIRSATHSQRAKYATAAVSSNYSVVDVCLLCSNLIQHGAATMAQ